MAEEELYFQVNLGGMLDILSNHLYTSADVFLRELLQNGVDAITLRRQKCPGWKGGCIHIRLVPGKKMVFTDNGAGLTREEINRFLSASPPSMIFCQGRCQGTISDDLALGFCPVLWCRIPL